MYMHHFRVRGALLQNSGYTNYSDIEPGSIIVLIQYAQIQRNLKY